MVLQVVLVMIKYTYSERLCFSLFHNNKFGSDMPEIMKIIKKKLNMDVSDLLCRSSFIFYDTKQVTFCNFLQCKFLRFLENKLGP